MLEGDYVIVLMLLDKFMLLYIVIFVEFGLVGVKYVMFLLDLCLDEVCLFLMLFSDVIKV